MPDAGTMDLATVGVTSEGRDEYKDDGPVFLMYLQHHRPLSNITWVTI